MTFKELINDSIFRKIFHYSFALLLGLGIFFGIYFTSSKDLVSTCNATFIPGCVLLGFSCFSLMNYWGFFDFAAYGFTSAIQALKKGSIREYKDLIDYKEKKADKRKENKWNFLTYLLCAVVWLVATLIIRLMMK